jgi:hypothetical protein
MHIYEVRARKDRRGLLPAGGALCLSKRAYPPGGYYPFALQRAFFFGWLAIIADPAGRELYCDRTRCKQPTGVALMEVYDLDQ